MTAGSAMRIDAHQHFWRYDPAQYGWIDDAMAVLRRDHLPAEAQREMTRAGIDACVAVQARQTLEETRWLLALADTDPFIAGVVGWVDLQSPDARAQLRECAAHPRLVGIRHIVQSEPDDRFMLRPAFCAGLALLEEFGLAYDILVYSRHLPVAAELADRVATMYAGKVVELADAKTIFAALQRKYPERFADGQLRTLQRKVKHWRATEGPAREVYFTQDHRPGELSQNSEEQCSRL